jgi:hypothetical protein
MAMVLQNAKTNIILDSAGEIAISRNQDNQALSIGKRLTGSYMTCM